MKVFKWRIPDYQERKMPSGVIVVGPCVAVVIEEDREAALARLREFCAEKGFPAEWIDVADVIVTDVRPAVVGFHA